MICITCQKDTWTNEEDLCRSCRLARLRDALAKVQALVEDDTPFRVWPDPPVVVGYARTLVVQIEDDEMAADWNAEMMEAMRLIVAAALNGEIEVKA